MTTAIDRERELILRYDDAHRAYLEALEALRAAVFGRAPANGPDAKAQVAAAKDRLAAAERELQEFWSTEAVAQEVGR
jgi:hypothetical protein